MANPHGDMLLKLLTQSSLVTQKEESDKSPFQSHLKHNFASHPFPPNFAASIPPIPPLPPSENQQALLEILKKGDGKVSEKQSFVSPFAAQKEDAVDDDNQLSPNQSTRVQDTTKNHTSSQNSPASPKKPGITLGRNFISYDTCPGSLYKGNVTEQDVSIIPNKVEFRPGRAILANEEYVCYAVRGGKLRVIHLLSGAHTLIRDLHHSKSDILDMEMIEVTSGVLRVMSVTEHSFSIIDVQYVKSTDDIEILLTISQGALNSRVMFHSFMKNLVFVSTGVQLMMMNIKRIKDSYPNFDAITDNEAITRLEFEDQISCFAISNDASFLVIATDSEMILYSVSFSPIKLHSMKINERLDSIGFVDTLIVSGSRNNTFIQLHTNTFDCYHVLALNNTFGNLCFHQGRQFFTVSGQNKLMVIHVNITDPQFSRITEIPMNKDVISFFANVEKEPKFYCMHPHVITEYITDSDIKGRGLKIVDNSEMLEIEGQEEIEYIQEQMERRIAEKKIVEEKKTKTDTKKPSDNITESRSASPQPREESNVNQETSDSVDLKKLISQLQIIQSKLDKTAISEERIAKSIASNLEDQLISSIKDYQKTQQEELINSIPKLISNPKFTRELALLLKPTIEQQLKLVFKDVFIPGMQKAVKEMFMQINHSLQNGVKQMNEKIEQDMTENLKKKMEELIDLYKMRDESMAVGDGY